MDRNGIVPKHSAVLVFVATREGGVDRNVECKAPAEVPYVATREGGVDRNKLLSDGSAKTITVATREGGVDRNFCQPFSRRQPHRRHPRGWRG